jgi:protein-disulfide isomerase
MVNPSNRIFAARRVVAGAAAILIATLVAGAADADPNRVVATVGAHSITERELDDKIRPQMSSLEAQVYELKKNAIQVLADDYLIEQAAKKSNLSVQDYLKRELDSKDNVVAEADARKYYDEFKDRIGRPYDQVKTQIIDGLTAQKVELRRRALVEKLRKEAPLKVMLAAPRYEVAAIGPSRGPADAPVTIVEFSDYQCPFCKRSETYIKEVLEKYGDKVRLVYRDFPLGNHPNATDAARAARCAGEQGKYWDMHGEIFANQSKLSRADLKALANKTGVNQPRFDACLDSAKYEADVKKDMLAGQDLGVDGTPTFFINGRRLVGAQPFEKFKEIIDQELATKGQPLAKAN